MEEGYHGWEKDTQGLWLYTGADVTWRDNFPSSSPISPTSVADGYSAQENQDTERKFHEEDYKGLVKYLQENEWWQTEY
jgi:hypothetical protein